MLGGLNMLSSIIAAAAACTTTTNCPNKLPANTPFAFMNYQTSVRQQQQLKHQQQQQIYNESLTKFVSNYNTNEYIQRFMGVHSHHTYAPLTQTQNGRYHPYSRPLLPNIDMSIYGSSLASTSSVDLNSPPLRISPILSRESP
jgi:hypothetical protein